LESARFDVENVDPDSGDFGYGDGTAKDRGYPYESFGYKISAMVFSLFDCDAGATLPPIMAAEPPV